MQKPKRTHQFSRLIYAAAIVFIDFAVFTFLGMGLASFDNSYYGAKTDDGLFSRMTGLEIFTSLVFYAWVILNIFGFIYLIRKIYKRLKSPAY